MAASSGVLKRGGRAARLVSQRFLGVYSTDTLLKAVAYVGRPHNCLAYSKESGFWRFDKDADDAAADNVLVPAVGDGRWLAATGGPGADVKATVTLATAAALPANTRTANVLLANAVGALGNIDGVAGVVGMRVLAKDEATGANRGLYEIDSIGGAGSKWQMTRTSDADGNDEVTAGMIVYVSQGTANGNRWFYLSTDDPVVVNTTAMTFVQVPSLADLASTAANLGASLVGVEDSGTNFAGTDAEACLAEIWDNLELTTTPGGASYVGVYDVATNFTGTDVEACLAEIMTLLASILTGEGAALVGVQDAGGNFTGTDVEACLAEIWDNLELTTSPGGASYIGVYDAAGNFTGADVEACLAEIMSLLASILTGEGAALVGVEDSGTNFAGTDAEACLAEIWDNLELTTTPGGASYVGVYDVATNFAGADVEACLAEIMTLLASTTASQGASLIGVEDSASLLTATDAEAALAELQVHAGVPMFNRVRMLGGGAAIAQGDTVSIGADTYEFRSSTPPLGGQPGRIWVYNGANSAASRANFITAVNGTVAASEVTRTAQDATAGTNTETVGAKAGVTVGDVVAYSADAIGGTIAPSTTATITSESLTNAADIWDQATMLSGQAADAVERAMATVTITAAMIAKGDLQVELPFNPTMCIVKNRMRQQDEAVTIVGNQVRLPLAGGVAPNNQAADVLDVIAYA